jgi:hypothetical protein
MLDQFMGVNRFDSYLLIGVAFVIVTLSVFRFHCSIVLFCYTANAKTKISQQLCLYCARKETVETGVCLHLY